MKFTGTFRAPRLNLQKYRTLLHEHLSEEIAHAAFVWLSAVLEEKGFWDLRTVCDLAGRRRVSVGRRGPAYA